MLSVKKTKTWKKTIDHCNKKSGVMWIVCIKRKKEELRI